jgi:hypothetical protein
MPERARVTRIFPREGAGLRVTAFQDIREVDPAEWDRVVSPDDLQARHAFVATCQEAGIADARYRHLLVHRDDELIAVATLTRMTVPLDLLSPSIVRGAVRGLRRVRPRILRPALLFCGLPVSAGRPCFAVTDPEEGPAVARAVVGAMEALAPEVGASVLCFKEFSPPEAAALGSLAPLGFLRMTSLPSFRMEVPWPSFDAYLNAMRAGYRRQMQAVLEQGRRSGLNMRVLSDFGEECEAIHALYGQVMDRAPFQLERLPLRFFRILNRRLPTASSAILVEEEGTPVAAAVLLRSPALLTFFMAGIDYDRNRRCAAYLNLAAEVVAEAIRTEAPELELGQTSEALKTRLGARPVPRVLFLRCRSRLAHRALEAGSRILFPAARVPARRVFAAGR